MVVELERPAAEGVVELVAVAIEGVLRYADFFLNILLCF